jgi:hypothetical protein
MTDDPNQTPANQNPAGTPPADTPAGDEEAVIGARINRLSGEAAPDLSPEEFARLQHGGAINIDSRGRIRVSRRDEVDPGVSLRKRRAWYA